MTDQKTNTRKDRLKALDALPHDPMELGPFSGGRGPNDATRMTHWRVARDEHDVAWVILDKARASTNTLSEDVLRELKELLGPLEKNPPKALVIRSAKKNGFVAGAEISEFRDMSNRAEAEKRLGDGLAIFQQLADFPSTTIALVHGFCLGGGLELALACDIRIGTDTSSYAFPEVRLGLHPGLAGTWRSLNLLDPVQAMTMMLTGRTVHAKKAKAIGLVDAVTPERHFAAAVRYAATGKLRLNRVPKWRRWLLNTMPARAILSSQMAKQARAKADPRHYPAPYAMIDLWREHGNARTALEKPETRSFVDLMTSDTAQNLIRAFFLQDRLKGYGKGIQARVSHVHVIGAGAMGGDIAAWCALKGFTVTVQDREMKYIAPAVKRAARLFGKKLFTEGDRRAAMDRLIPDLKGVGIGSADIVIEAVPEVLDIKKSVFKAAEAEMRDDAILATNTSTILLEEMTSAVKRPGRLVGVHFFNPVAAMPLVEIITHDKLDDDIRDRALAFTTKIGKLPLPVKSAPGFLVNRALLPYLMEALACLDEGIKPEAIDAAALAFGMPTGPIELSDQVGLDIALHASEILRDGIKRDFPEIPVWFREKVERGDLGRKTGKGLYEWKDGKAQKADTEAGEDDKLADRLILPLLDACVACLDEKLIGHADDVDAGMIFGTGFAPFRGGPLHYARARGIADCVDALENLARIHGPRFTPSPGWKKLK